ncbi:hypothetical protein BH11PSE7_BH11PSE7_24750 [soil metagenome]
MPIRFHVHRLFTLFVLTAAATGALPATPAPDLMDSAQCKSARQLFDAAFDAAKDRAPEAVARLDEARVRAAQACFGAASARPSGGRSPGPTIVTPQAAVLPRNRMLSPPPVTATPAPPVPIQRPPTLGNCDPGGCWGTDGTRLNRVGPELNGPRGACVVQGTFVNCP